MKHSFHVQYLVTLQWCQTMRLNLTNWKLTETAHRYESVTSTITPPHSFLGFHIGLSIWREVGSIDDSLLHTILTGWFLDTKTSKKIQMNIHLEGLPQKCITIRHTSHSAKQMFQKYSVCTALCCRDLTLTFVLMFTLPDIFTLIKLYCTVIRQIISKTYYILCQSKAI
jgi:hypothetical protein